MQWQIAGHRFGDIFLQLSKHFQWFPHKLFNFQSYMMDHDIIFTKQQCCAWVLMKRFNVILCSRCWRVVALVRAYPRIVGACMDSLDVQHRPSRCLRGGLRRNDVPLNQLVGWRVRPKMILRFSAWIVECTRADQQWWQNGSVIRVSHQGLFVVISICIRNKMIDNSSQPLLVQSNANPQVSGKYFRQNERVFRSFFAARFWKLFYIWKLAKNCGVRLLLWNSETSFVTSEKSFPRICEKNSDAGNHKYRNRVTTVEMLRR